MSVNITVVTYNRLELTRVCLESLLAKTQGTYTLHIVDNASSDGTQAYLQALASKHSHVKVLCLASNMGVAVAANMGWVSMDAPYYLKLDNDIEILDPLWLQRLVATAEQKNTFGMLGYELLPWPCRKQILTLPDGTLFESTDLCNGGCVLIPQRAHAKLGFWIEDHGKYGYEDKNYGDRALQAGYKIGYIRGPQPAVRHMGFDDGCVDEQLESLKKNNREQQHQGEALYVLNKFLFETGVRKLYVERRYVPQWRGEQFRFALNPAYKPIVELHKQYLDKIGYEGLEQGIRLDLSQLQTQKK